MNFGENYIENLPLTPISQWLGLLVGVRGCPERDIPSLCVMGWGWEMLGNSSAVVAAVVAAAAAVPPKVGVFWLPFPSRMGSRIEISGHPSEHPAQNCATVFLYVHKNHEKSMQIT